MTEKNKGQTAEQVAIREVIDILWKADLLIRPGKNADRRAAREMIEKASGDLLNIAWKLNTVEPE
jgi:hypothetical protein